MNEHLKRGHKNIILLAKQQANTDTKNRQEFTTTGKEETVLCFRYENFMFQ